MDACVNHKAIVILFAGCQFCVRSQPRILVTWLFDMSAESMSFSLKFSYKILFKPRCLQMNNGL